MKELFNVVSYTIIETFKILKSVTTSLLSNEIFIIILAIVVLSSIVGIILYMLNRKKYKYKKIRIKTHDGYKYDRTVIFEDKNGNFSEEAFKQYWSDIAKKNKRGYKKMGMTKADEMYEGLDMSYFD